MARKKARATLTVASSVYLPPDDTRPPSGLRKTTFADYYARNRERVLAKNHEWYKANGSAMSDARLLKRFKGDRRAMNEYRRSLKHRVKARAFAYLGGKCCKCGFADERALQVDHVNGTENDDNYCRGEKLYRAVLRGEAPPVQLLCANCNSIKRFENGEGCHARKEPLSA